MVGTRTTKYQILKCTTHTTTMGTTARMTRANLVLILARVWRGVGFVNGFFYAVSVWRIKFCWQITIVVDATFPNLESSGLLF